MKIKGLVQLSYVLCQSKKKFNLYVSTRNEEGVTINVEFYNCENAWFNELKYDELYLNEFIVDSIIIDKRVPEIFVTRA